MQSLAVAWLVASFVFVLGAAPAVPASAALPTLTIDPGYGPPLTVVKVAGRSFCSTCGAIQVTVSSLYVNSTPVRKDGTFSIFVRIPGSTRPGTASIVAAQARPGFSARTTFVVTIDRPAPTTYPVPKSVPPPGGLPNATGVSPGTSTARVPTTSSSASPSATPASTTPSSSAAPSPPVTSNATTTDVQSSAASSGPTRNGTGGVVLVSLAAAVAAAVAATTWWLRRRRYQR